MLQNHQNFEQNFQPSKMHMNSLTRMLSKLVIWQLGEEMTEDISIIKRQNYHQNASLIQDALGYHKE
jgi:hypothetical protein